jgi:hypothetical protein
MSALAAHGTTPRLWRWTRRGAAIAFAFRLVVGATGFAAVVLVLIG